jgi:hypothetical protein
MGPCDLCSYARVITMLGIANIDKAYSAVVMLNSGTRGPLGAGSEIWLDVIGLRIPKSNYSPFVVSVSISFEVQFHPQSYFLMTPLSAFRDILYPLYNESCLGTKLQCILQSEIPAGQALMEAGFSFFSLSQRAAVTGPDEMEALEVQQGKRNPTMGWLDPCDSVFVKYGGEVWRERMIPADVISAVEGICTEQDAYAENHHRSGVPSDADVWKGCAGADCAW